MIKKKAVVMSGEEYKKLMKKATTYDKLNREKSQFETKMELMSEEKEGKKIND